MDSLDAVSGLIESGAGYTGAGGAGRGWSDPFADMASLAMPRTIQTALRLCQFLIENNGTYRAALEKVVRYFLTDIVIKGDRIGRVEKQEMKDYLLDDLHVMDYLEAILMDKECYGNAFTSLIERFRRYYICPNCRYEVSFDYMERLREAGQATWQDWSMKATCPKCHTAAKWAIHDRRGGTDEDYRVKRWSPIELELIWDPYSDRVSQVWKIPEDMRRWVEQGKPEVLREVPVAIIEAIKTSGYIKFGPGFVHHSKDLSLAGLWNRGWGLSRVLVNYRQAWYVQVLRRYNEAIALDYVMPFRVLTPAGTGGTDTGDPLAAMDLGNYQAQVESMIDKHRLDPAGWNFLPFALNYQALGGEAAELAPYQLMDQGMASLLDAINVPVQMYKMDLTLQAAPVALRLFESVHRGIPRTANRVLRHLMQRLVRFKHWPDATVSLMPTSLIDDVSKQMPRVQLMGQGQVSPQTGMAAIGLNAFDELRNINEYQEFQAEETERIQEQMEQSDAQRQMTAPPLLAYQQAQQAQQQQGSGQAAPGGSQGAAGQPAPGGAPAQFAAAAPPSGNLPVSPQDVLSKAQTIASNLLGQPESVKDSTLLQLHKQDPLLNLAVRDALDKARDAARQATGGQPQFNKVGVCELSRQLIKMPQGRHS